MPQRQPEPGPQPEPFARTLTLTRWGNDLFWFSFVGIILPLRQDDDAGKTTTQRPVSLCDQNGDPTTIEQLIIRHKRKKLLETPLMLDVIERKWNFFASELYTARILKMSRTLNPTLTPTLTPTLAPTRLTR